MRVLVLGVNGMAGHVIAQTQRAAGNEVVGFARSAGPFAGPMVQGDVRDFELVSRTLESGQYDLVVNCIGVLNRVADSQPADTVLINSYLPHFLAERVQNAGGRLIHLSTDCVFSGTSGPYDAADASDATDLYGRSKALGEPRGDRVLVIRTSIIGPELTTTGSGLFGWFMRQSGKISGYEEVFWSGVTTVQLASALLEIPDSVEGLIQLSAAEPVSKYALLKLIQREFGRKDIEIVPVAEPRSNKALRPTRGFDQVVVPYAEMIGDMRAWIRDNQELYPHYLTS